MADTPTYHSANLRKHRRMEGAGTFFITKNLQPKKRILTDSIDSNLPAQIICDAFRFAVENQRFSLSAFVIMPSHWHAILGVIEDSAQENATSQAMPDCLLMNDPMLRPDKTHDPSVSREMQRMNSWVSNETLPILRSVDCSWQEGFYETRIRSTKQFQYILKYIENNPSRAGLVDVPVQWRWSSTNSDHESMLLRPWPWRFEYDR